MLSPDYIFETSWEVCNRVGGIYAVLSTRAASMQAEHPDKVFFFGVDFVIVYFFHKILLTNCGFLFEVFSFINCIDDI